MAKDYTGGANPALRDQCELIEAHQALRAELEKAFPDAQRVNQAETKVRIAESRLQAGLDGRITREKVER